MFVNPSPLADTPACRVHFASSSAGKDVQPGESTTSHDVRVTSLSCVFDLNDDQRQEHYRRVVREIDVAAAAANKEKGRTPMDAQAILKQDPHHRPDAPDRSPAPLVHAHDASKRDEYLAAYRVFVANFRAGVDGLKARAKQIIELFPDWSFPPALPFKAAVSAGTA